MNRTICRSFGLDILGKTLLALTIAFSVLYVLPMSIAGIAKTVSAAETVEVWWPAQNASLEGAQPFKAIVKDKTLADYQMFWQVDGGSLVPMQNSQTDYPHKEALVDLSGWKWNANGTYAVTFVAKDLSGSEIGRNTISIKNSSQAASTAPVTVTAPVTAVSTSATPVISNQTTTQTLSNPTASVVLPKTTETARLVKVTSPIVGSRVSGTVPLKAIVIGLPLGGYDMYWSVDGGAETKLYDSSVGGLHKEAMIDFSTWTWKGTLPYVIKVTAKDSSSAEIAKTSTLVYTKASAATATNASQTTTQAPTPAPTTTVSPAPAPAPSAPTPAPVTSDSKLYVEPYSPAWNQAKTWRTTKPVEAGVMDKLGATPTSIWLGGWNSDVKADVAKHIVASSAENTLPTFVAYNIPGRDCGSYSAGGASDATSYVSWIKQISAGLGSGKAILILEPDGLASIDCLSDSQKADRYSMLSQALDIFKANNSGTKVYVDAGNSGWIDSSTMAGRLTKAGVSKAAGFALNVSNFFTTAQNTDYGTRVSALAGGAHFLIDTSRNGNGSNNGEWCNPSGMALGKSPTLSTGNSLIDAYLWVKVPGQSDGNCNGAPSAGGWWPEYALGLAKSAGWY